MEMLIPLSPQAVQPALPASTSSFQKYAGRPPYKTKPAGRPWDNAAHSLPPASNTRRTGKAKTAFAKLRKGGNKEWTCLHALGFYLLSIQIFLTMKVLSAITRYGKRESELIPVGGLTLMFSSICPCSPHTCMNTQAHTCTYTPAHTYANLPTDTRGLRVPPRARSLGAACAQQHLPCGDGALPSTC